MFSGVVSTDDTITYSDGEGKELSLLSDEVLYDRYLRGAENEALKILLIRHRDELTFFDPC